MTLMALMAQMNTGGGGREMELEQHYKHSDLTGAIVGVFYDAYNELGFGFLESVYRKALRLALVERGLAVSAEVPVSVYFRGVNIGDFRADLVVNDLILLEIKTAERIVRAHEAQILNYLRSTKFELGLILNFGPQPQIKKFVSITSGNNQNRAGQEKASDFPKNLCDLCHQCNQW